MSIDIKRKQVELARVSAARQEMELKIEERLEEINRLKSNITIQLERENTLKTEIETMEGNQ